MLSLLQLSERIAKERRDAEEMEEVRMELVIEEQEAKLQKKEREANAKRARDIEDLQRVHQEQLYFKQLREEAERREAEEFRAQMMAKFAEDDRIEQMNAHKRRMKLLEHKRAVEELLKDRHARFEAARVRSFNTLAHSVSSYPLKCSCDVVVLTEG